MTPSQICEKYLENRICSDEYVRQLRKLSGKLESLTADAVNAHLRARKDSIKPITLSNERRQAITLWRWAYEEGMVDAAPRGVMRLRVTPVPVRAWTMAECRALVKEAEKFSGKRLRNGADLGAFLRCWVLLGYETGARYGDIFAWTSENLCGNAVGWVTSKTGVICTRVLSDAAVASAREMLAVSPDKRILGWVASRRYSFRLFRKLLSLAGVSGSGRWLRRSAATHVEMEQPGRAQWFLAHRTPGLASRHYLDASQLSAQVPRAPKLT